jgi:hypothetical protein
MLIQCQDRAALYRWIDDLSLEKIGPWSEGERLTVELLSVISLSVFWRQNMIVCRVGTDSGTQRVFSFPHLESLKRPEDGLFSFLTLASLSALLAEEVASLSQRIADISAVQVGLSVDFKKSVKR